MEKLKQLPLGYRFKPTDLELIRDYLIKKMKNQQLSCNAVVEYNVYRTEPWNLKGSADDIGGAIDKGYYFVNREKKSANVDGTRPSRSVYLGNGSKVGFWKATGGDKAIRDKRNKLVGVKKSLKYYRYTNDNKITKDSKSMGWIMHEYTVAPTKNKFQPWVLCSIRFNGTDKDYQEQHQNLEQEVPVEHQEVVDDDDQKGKQQLLMPCPAATDQNIIFKEQDSRFKVADEDDIIMLDYAKGGEGSGEGLPHVPIRTQDQQLTNDNNAHDYRGDQEDWTDDEISKLIFTDDDQYSYNFHLPGTAFNGAHQQWAGFTLNNKFN